MDKELLKRKISQIDRALERIKKYFPSSVNKFQHDFTAQDVVYRNFIILVQNMVDMGSHVVSRKTLPTPRSMKDIFDLLSQHRYISPTLGKKLKEMVTVRNIIVHDYTRVSPKKVHRLLKANLTVVPKFCLTLLKLK